VLETYHLFPLDLELNVGWKGGWPLINDQFYILNLIYINFLLEIVKCDTLTLRKVGRDFGVFPSFPLL
jgi:hypothetical protein